MVPGPQARTDAAAYNTLPRDSYDLRADWAVPPTTTTGGTSDGNQRPNLVGQAVNGYRTTQYLNPKAFTVPKTWGNPGANAYCGVNTGSFSNNPPMNIGQVSSATAPRTVQFSLRVSF